MCKFRWGLFLWLTVLEALHWGSAGKSLTWLPAVVVMETWTGKMAGSCNSFSLRGLKMVCLGHQYSSPLVTSTRGHNSGSKWAFTPDCFLCSKST